MAPKRQETMRATRIRPKIFISISFLSWFVKFSFSWLHTYYITIITFCQYFYKSFYYDLDVWRLNTPVYATGKRSCLLCLRRRLFVVVLQGLPRSPQPLVLRMPAATPHLLSSSAVARLSIGWEWLAVPPWVLRVFGRSVAPLPSSLRVYYTTKRLVCQYFFKSFLTDLDVWRLNFRQWEKGVAALFINSFRHNRHDKGCQPFLRDCKTEKRNRNPYSKKR